MRIAIFHELLPGGARNVAEEQSRWLSKNHSVDLYYIDSMIDRTLDGIANNIYFHKFIDRKWFGNSAKDKLYKDTIELYKLQNLHKKIANEINKKDYDIVLVHSSKFTQSPFLLSFLKLPTAYYSHEPLRMIYDPSVKTLKNIGALKNTYEKLNFSIRKHIDKTNFKKAGLVLVNSKFCKKWTENTYNVKNVEVCYPGIDTDVFNKKNIKKEYDFIFIGNKLEIEGYDLLSKVINKNKFKYKIVERDANGKGIPKNDLIILINKSKLVLCLSKNEPLGLIPLEAMSCGVPVIAVNEGGYKETIISGKTGYLIKRDSKDLSEKVNFLINNQKILNEMEKNCRKHIIQNWTWNKNIKILEKKLNEYIKKI